MDRSGSFDEHAAARFGRAVSEERDLARWQAVIQQAARSKIVFFSKSGGTQTIAHMARVDGKWIIVHFYASGRRTGELVSAWWVGRNSRIYVRR